MLDRIADERDVKIVKVNVDQEQGLALRYGVSSIPLMVLFENGEPQAQAVGALPKSALERALGLSDESPRRLGEHRVGELRPGVLRPVAELEVGEAGEGEPGLGIDPEEPAAAAEVAEGGGELRVPVQCGRLPSRSSRPRPQSFGSKRPKPGRTPPSPGNCDA